MLRDKPSTTEIRELIWDYYRHHGRNTLSWRQPEEDGSFDAYKILVSELMLQQTQVARVVPKFQEFLKLFPSASSLAEAPLGDVLRAWSGLGYNRRAKYLHEAAKTLRRHKQPWTMEQLEACKGIGFNTAAAIITYAYNQPLVFIETNIRTVLIHHFFTDDSAISDKQLLPFMEGLLDKEFTREFYWAMMDYGSFLKATVGNQASASKHYVRQSTFKGSRREVRGQVVARLRHSPATLSDLQESISDGRLESVLDVLQKEGLITLRNQTFQLG